ncbi:MAG: hypothetical protein R3F62_22850 [Planctomycetota bacterium]
MLGRAPRTGHVPRQQVRARRRRSRPRALGLDAAAASAACAPRAVAREARGLGQGQGRGGFEVPRVPRPRGVEGVGRDVARLLACAEQREHLRALDPRLEREERVGVLGVGGGLLQEPARLVRLEGLRREQGAVAGAERAQPGLAQPGGRARKVSPRARQVAHAQPGRAQVQPSSAARASSPRARKVASTGSRVAAHPR